MIQYFILHLVLANLILFTNYCLVFWLEGMGSKSLSQRQRKRAREEVEKKLEIKECKEEKVKSEDKRVKTQEEKSRDSKVSGCFITYLLVTNYFLIIFSLFSLLICHSFFSCFFSCFLSSILVLWYCRVNSVLVIRCVLFHCISLHPLFVGLVTVHLVTSMWWHCFRIGRFISIRGFFTIGGFFTISFLSLGLWVLCEFTMNSVPLRKLKIWIYAKLR